MTDKIEAGADLVSTITSLFLNSYALVKISPELLSLERSCFWVIFFRKNPFVMGSGVWAAVTAKNTNAANNLASIETV